MTFIPSLSYIWNRKFFNALKKEQGIPSSEASLGILNDTKKPCQYTFIDLSTNSDYQKYLELEYVDYKRVSSFDLSSYSDFLKKKF